jgi:hypothetical protein
MNPPEEHLNHQSLQPSQGGLSQDIKHASPISRTDFVENNSLDKVRDILFGNQMKDVDRKLVRLEERLSKECSNLRDETRKRLDSLENYIKQEVGSLSDRLKAEQSEREIGVKSLAEEHKNITMSLERKLAQFDEQNSSAQSELREQILSQSRSFHDDIQQKYQEILVLLEREAQELRGEKANRSTLAALFTELAVRLNSQV